MLNKPTLWNRLAAHVGGELCAADLEAYRRASVSVYEVLRRAEAHREEAKSGGLSPWALPASRQAEALCAWNAFVLQSLGDAILQADYEADRSTMGFVPPATAEQILRFYSQVGGWLSRAEQARANPDYELDIQAPARLPPWSAAKPSPRTHMAGLTEAMRAIGAHATAATHSLDAMAQGSQEEQRQRNAIRALQSSAELKARYAEGMVGQSASQDVHDRVEEHVRGAIESFFLLGQLLAVPEWAVRGTAPSSSPEVPRRAGAFGVPTGNFANVSRDPLLPGAQGFDIWCLTDPEAVPLFQRDPKAVQALQTLWQLDPEPKRTLAIQAEIDAALKRGDIAYATDRRGRRLEHFFCLPWPPAYTVRRDVTLGGRRLSSKEQFIFNVTCEGVNLGAPFEREIIVATFSPTSDVGYGDPDEEPDH